MDERRTAKRYPIWFPMSVDSDPLQDGLAVSQNISKSGLLMATAAKLEVGATVTVTFQLTRRDPVQRRIEGRIVRIQANAEDPEGLWPSFVAVAFDEAAPEIEPLLEELAASGAYGT
ncbi:MAG: PilZ domain-containing protein [Deltaproteobacteria bacterium]|nr:PilZ domain-containing protein [Deltaproteobacteria bacterium]